MHNYAAMTAIRHILFPTNCRPHDARAFEYALAVARYFMARVKVLHICEPSMGIMVPGIVRYQLNREQKKTAQHLLAKWVSTFDPEGVVVEQQVELGFPKETIAFYANQQQPDLLVMGTKDNHSFTKLLRGTIISKTVEQVQCPVLLVPKGIVFQSIQNMAYVTPVVEDWRPTYPLLQDIAQTFGARLYVTHLQEAPKEVLDGDQHLVLEDYGRALHALIYNTNLHLLVTLESVRGTLQKMLQYSKAQKMAFETLIPLLILKKPPS